MGRTRIRPALKAGLRAGVSAARALTPTRPHLVVSGWPDTEGNAVEVVRWVLRERTEHVVWVTEDLDAAGALSLLGDVDARRLRVRPKRSWQGFWAYLTARVVLFTHGLYLSPEPRSGEVFVNLWHGDGPKSTRAAATNRPPSSTYVVSGAELFGLRKLDFFGSWTDLVLSGNPRCDQLLDPAADADLAALGLDPAVPFLVYMPTFRSARAVGSKAAWSDGDAGGEDASSAMLDGLVEGAAEAGLQVVVKPHPLDTESYARPGVVRVDNGQLRAAGVAMYRMLARSAALVTDYSSVWTDYLLLDRPMAFALNDLDGYSSSRGLDVDDLAEILPGPALHTPEDCAYFASTALKDTPELEDARARSAERIGLVRRTSACAALFDTLVAEGVLAP